MHRVGALVMITTRRGMLNVMQHALADLWIIVEDSLEGFLPWLWRQQIVLTQRDVQRESNDTFHVDLVPPLLEDAALILVGPLHEAG